MKNLIERHWMSLLGVSFLFLAFIYFLKLAFNAGYFPPMARATSGLVLGVTCLFGAYAAHRSKKLKSPILEPSIIVELLAGLGTSIIYATIAYISFSDDINWPLNIIGIVLVGLSTLLSITSYKLNMRILANISIVGGFLTPLLIRAQVGQDVVLFIYIALLNLVALYLSTIKNWQELRLLSFLSTLIIYSSYYIYFEPATWGRPFFYCSSIFVVYMIGLVASSIHQGHKFDGLNLYIGLINAINFVVWSVIIFSNFNYSYAIPLSIVGVSFIATGIVIHQLAAQGKSSLASMAYLILGVLILAVSLNDLGHYFPGEGMLNIVSAASWLFIGASFLSIGLFLRNQVCFAIGLMTWAMTLFFWFTVAWKVAWPAHYIPFLNPGALVWFGFAITGFSFSKLIQSHNHALEIKNANNIGLVMAIISHIVIGGLITIQLSNAWKAYEISLNLSFVMSVSWFVYALSLFIWGAYVRNKVFKYFGTAVIALTTLKIMFFDLRAETNVYKVILLIIVGGIALLINFINNKWLSPDEPQKSPTTQIEEA